MTTCLKPLDKFRTDHPMLTVIGERPHPVTNIGERRQIASRVIPEVDRPIPNQQVVGHRIQPGTIPVENKTPARLVLHELNLPTRPIRQRGLIAELVTQPHQTP